MSTKFPSETKRIIAPALIDEDQNFDLTLRPKKMTDFVGQEKMKENLKISVSAAKKRREPLEHLLFYGPPGTGKTSISHIVAHEMGAGIRVTSGPALERAGDLAAVLTNLQEGDILFIDECHRIPKIVEEVLYPAMEDFALDLIIGKGPSARTLRLDLPHFTMIGATTRIGLLSSPLRDRFGAIYRLNYYHEEDIEKILYRSAKIIKVKLEKEGAYEIAKRSRGTPRVANRLLKRVRDFAQVKGNGVIAAKTAGSAFLNLEIDSFGLDEIDRRLLSALIEKFDGGPAGIQALASATSEEEETILEVYEPFLLQRGFLCRTPRGRCATRLAYEHLGQKWSEDNQKKLL
ncbi:MAG: Holliday junction branch migration DNA helicase RuvB [Patescibacteria group bacterium]